MIDIQDYYSSPDALSEDNQCDSCGQKFYNGQVMRSVMAGDKVLHLCHSPANGEIGCAEKLRRLLNP